VVGDLFQNYAAKYVGISRGIPLSNTNQLWGLLWGILVFSELHGLTRGVYAQVIGGSLLMAAGASRLHSRPQRRGSTRVGKKRPSGRAISTTSSPPT
jgi:glucose uptake protein GlcU